jgi:hypothetical protein
MTAFSLKIKKLKQAWLSDYIDVNFSGTMISLNYKAHKNPYMGCISPYLKRGYPFSIFVSSLW